MSVLTARCPHVAGDDAAVSLLVHARCNCDSAACDKLDGGNGCAQTDAPSVRVVGSWLCKAAGWRPSAAVQLVVSLVCVLAVLWWLDGVHVPAVASSHFHAASPALPRPTQYSLNAYRLSVLFDRLQRGESIAVGVIGGSNSAGHGLLSNDNLFHNFLLAWLTSRFPPAANGTRHSVRN